MNYTEQELEEAKAYLRDRLRNERSMSAEVERVLWMYAGFLLTALFRHASEDDIALLIDDLVEQLMADVESLAVDEHDRKDAILLYMNREIEGETLESRVRGRANTFYNEVFAVFVAGSLLGKKHNDYEEIWSSIKSSFDDPWKNPIIEEAREKMFKGELADVYDFDEPHFGKGEPISSKKALDRTLRYAVADSWMYWQHEDALARGAKGYYVLRGSSYPCPECDSHTGIFYPVGDDENRPQYHLNCCCIVVYSYVDRL